MHSGFSIISLYTGAGGLDLGLEAAGGKTKVAIELDIDAVATIKANRNWHVIGEDIHNPAASSNRILHVAGLKVGETDLLVGGPPCQPFSKSGYWASGDSRRLADPRATTLEAYLRVLRDTQPRAFLLENVPGLAFRSKSEGLDLLRATIDSINAEIGTRYSCEVALLRAVEFGVPQDRQRVFIVGARDGTAFRWPKPSHARPIADTDGDGDVQQELSRSEDLPRQPFLNAWDAIADLEENDDPSLRVGGKWADLLPTIPEGKNYLFHTDRREGLPLFGWRRRYWTFLLKAAKGLPCWTLTADPGSAIGPFHWKNRRFSAQEMMRLQTFPSGYVIAGNKRSVQRQLGNAVPSALAEVLGFEIVSQLLGGPSSRLRSPTLIPIRRPDLPSPEPVEPVPLKYRELIGSHDAHPGTGLGYGALRRQA